MINSLKIKIKLIVGAFDKSHLQFIK